MAFTFKNMGIENFSPSVLEKNNNQRVDNIECIIDSNRTNKYFKNGLLHRDNDLPAIEYASGYKEWYIEGKLHRDNDLPSIIDLDGTKKYYKNGLLHRDNDEPAIEYGNVIARRNLDSNDEEDFIYVTEYSNVVGDKEWYQFGQRHRDNDKPAVKYKNGCQKWYLNDKLHRETNYATTNDLGEREYWLYGHQLSYSDFLIFLEKKELNEKLETNLIKKEVILSKRLKI